MLHYYIQLCSFLGPHPKHDQTRRQRDDGYDQTHGIIRGEMRLKRQISVVINVMPVANVIDFDRSEGNKLFSSSFFFRCCHRSATMHVRTQLGHSLWCIRRKSCCHLGGREFPRRSCLIFGRNFPENFLVIVSCER